MAARKRALKPVRRRPEGFSLWEREKRCERLVFFLRVCLSSFGGERGMDGWMDGYFLFLLFFSICLFFTSSLLLLLLNKKFLIFLACVPGYLHLHAIFS